MGIGKGQAVRGNLEWRKTRELNIILGAKRSSADGFNVCWKGLTGLGIFLGNMDSKGTKYLKGNVF